MRPLDCITPDATGHERDRVRRAVIRSGPATVADLAVGLRLDEPRVAAHLDVLADAGVVERDRAQRWSYRTETRRLRLATGYMVVGEGERHDCARYDACLDAFLAAAVARKTPQGGSWDMPARCGVTCPCRGRDRGCDCHGTGCRWHERPTPLSAADYARVTDHDASIYCGGGA